MRQKFNSVPYDLAGAASRVGVAVVALAVLSQSAAAQSFRMPSTLRYGSGLIDVPVAWVLPRAKGPASSASPIRRSPSRTSRWPSSTAA